MTRGTSRIKSSFDNKSAEETAPTMSIWNKLRQHARTQILDRFDNKSAEETAPTMSIWNKLRQHARTQILDRLTTERSTVTFIDAASIAMLAQFAQKNLQKSGLQSWPIAA
ncbi:hypothetical protein QE152_g11016 [Popillia japonica]|uniref:Uncharacterized protein n=1 Tax=Popillia japonica TaxID=7064 RepID=A0AAW1LTC5_POPJA